MIHKILKEINLENGSKYKIGVLKKHKDNELLQRVLKLANDKVAYTYGVSIEQIEKFTPENTNPIDLEFALDQLENEFSTRKITGHTALQQASTIIGNLSDKDADVFKKIINHDLKIGITTTSINKVFKGLITKPVYKRCDIYTPKTSSNVSYPAYIQLKADGTYREFNVENGSVISCSRSGERHEYPLIFDEMSTYKNGYYFGELTVVCSDEIIEIIKVKLEKAIKRGDDTEKLEEVINSYNSHKLQGKEYILPRAVGNGLTNSDDVPHNNLVLDLWEYVTQEEYSKAGLKNKKNPCTISYKENFDELLKIVGTGGNVKVIEHKIVNNLKEALEIVSDWMKQGFEGGILKDFNAVMKDGTSKFQLKLKLKISLEMRCIGFHDGAVNSKREGKIGSLIFENDEGTIKGKCSGFTDKELDYFTENKEEILGKVMEIECNDVTKAEGNKYHSLSYPQFVDWREKDTTDTLERALKEKQMAMELN